jgi:hypothetical protein
MTPAIGFGENGEAYDADKALRAIDYLTKSDFTRKEILGPKSFHDLLCARVDASARGAESEAK